MTVLAHSPNDAPRRSFLARIGAAALVALVPTTAEGRAHEDDAAGAAATKLVPGGKDPWLARLTGKHKQLFHTYNSRDGRALMEAANFLDTYPKAYGVRARDVNAVVAAHGSMLGMVIGDTLWAKYRLGELASFNDPKTRAPATRNIYLAEGEGELLGPGLSVASLAKRGVVFLACNTALSQLSRVLAERTDQAQRDVHRELVEALVPGTFVVPAMIIAISRAQEAGCTYLYCE